MIFQASGETDKAVGFMDPIADPALESAIARRVIHARTQPASTFMNALRERVSFARRAGGRSTRSGDSYLNGACYGRRVLAAVLNIFRIHYNFFEPRQYVLPINKHDETDPVRDGLTSLEVRGSSCPSGGAWRPLSARRPCGPASTE